MQKKRHKKQKVIQGFLDECTRYHHQCKKLQIAAYKYDIGYRVLNHVNGHCRVDSTVDYWLGSEVWIDGDSRGKGLNSMIAHIMGDRGE